ncbi:uncharacterized protein Z520_09215 [Fonsecaea multimorphosa CBS 102226]|uniref:Uncharacterized protein n=1 Tax=Fonsecaea multimorphosa CBS 102226 TaxID=1442371 RepID=A0A0D2GZH7_9EURO|nr:uncharacterized protein Z520_09215 [Fonsecaea multimorphosa CBS 102226]KIX94905.1 hypothetical protein Z520_09215 [Fonsecaea multimorphosa CBS 102226]OAL20557.1 hypothetical protein AYO22_08566 [Fonsecaea multimorphosa]
MSIWDAMKGVPDRKPRKQKLLEDSKFEDKKDAKNKDNNKKGENDAKGKDKHDDSDLTEDDRIILRMKGENQQAQWKDILAETTNFKHVGELKARWKHISHRLEAESKHESKEGRKDKDPDREERIKRHREEGLRRKAEREAARAKRQEEENNAEEPKAEYSTKSDKNDNDSKWAKSDSKARKPSSSPHSLKEWADEYDKKKWHMLAAKHYDKTGERITADRARRLAETE